mmetsp:Transcript_46795/g.100772  ORF Transcript_46795/g.100772 Transcript_46795/m.100772 type:complete len:191 (+) Transcript_46795:232-804(+)
MATARCSCCFIMMMLLSFVSHNVLALDEEIGSADDMMSNETQEDVVSTKDNAAYMGDAGKTLERYGYCALLSAFATLGVCAAGKVYRDCKMVDAACAGTTAKPVSRNASSLPSFDVEAHHIIVFAGPSFVPTTAPALSSPASTATTATTTTTTTMMRAGDLGEGAIADAGDMELSSDSPYSSTRTGPTQV